MAGIRLDSGDLAYLSIEARRMLDDAGFKDATILASNNLDEGLIASLKAQGARIDAWGVGTKLVTAYDEPALGGVYKLTAIRDEDDQRWDYRIKVSEQFRKASIPGLLQVRRFHRDGRFIGDAIYDEQMGMPHVRLVVDPSDGTRRKRIPDDAVGADLLVPVFRKGRRVADPEPLETIRRRCRDELSGFHPGIRRLVNPHEYPAGLADNLFDLRSRMVLERR
jgi:nicotinate phosphoribosyltransferase